MMHCLCPVVIARVGFQFLSVCVCDKHLLACIEGSAAVVETKTMACQVSLPAGILMYICQRVETVWVSGKI